MKLFCHSPKLVLFHFHHKLLDFWQIIETNDGKPNHLVDYQPPIFYFKTWKMFATLTFLSFPIPIYNKQMSESK